ncbi:MAG: adenylate kinase [Anaerolineae bacterium]
MLLGPPGAGKGTQASRLAERLGLLHLSTGDLFREAIATGSDLGRQVEAILDRGELVPDKVTVGMVRERMELPDAADGVVLDGFPRTVSQAEALEELLSDRAQRLDGVLYIQVGEEELIRRLSGRRICRNCGTNYHVQFRPPRQEGVCDICGGVLYQREDDRPETVRHRIQVYLEATSPLIEYYRRRGLLREIDGEGEIEAVQQRIGEAVERPAGKGFPGSLSDGGSVGTPR